MQTADLRGISALPEHERVAARQKALEWLRVFQAENLRRYRKNPEKNKTSFPEAVDMLLLNSVDLASVRDPVKLKLLPKAEQEAWQKFWDEVRAVRAEIKPVPMNK